MKDWYFSFVTEADPNRVTWLNSGADKKPMWPPYKDNAQILVAKDDRIDTATDPEVGEKCDFWKSQSELTRI
jgi:hypothetical protein